MNIRKIMVKSLVIMGFTSSIMACTKTSNDLLAEMDWDTFLRQHDMYWRELTADPVQAKNDNFLKGGYYAGAIMGNGLLGTNLYKLEDNIYRLNVGRSDVTEIRKPYNLFNSARLPIGYFTLSTVGKVQQEEMRLSLYNATTQGIFTTDCGDIQFNTYVHATDNYIVFESASSGKEVDYKWNFVPQKAISPRIYSRDDSNGKYLNHEGNANPPIELHKEGDIHYAVQKLVTDTTMTQVGKVYVVAWREDRDHAKRRMIATVSYEDNEQTAVRTALSTIKKGFNLSSYKLLSQHKGWWNQFYQHAAFLTFPDKRIESFYWSQYYKFASTARPGKPIVDLQGVWPTWDTPWTAVWINLNLQLTYSWQTKANLGQLAEPLWESIHRNFENLKRNVTDIPSQKDWTDAACLGRTSTYDFLAPLNPKLVERNQYEVGNLTWLLYYYWQYCNAYADDVQMKERLFPMLKAAINLFFHIRTEKDGQYGLPATASPEYTKENVGTNANYDLANLRWGLQTLIALNNEYQLNDPMLPQWQDFLDHLVDYPYDKATGYKVSDKFKFENVSHRHYSHLFMIYPYHMVNWDNKADRRKIELSVNHWKGDQGYSRTGKAAMLLSMDKGDEALKQMNIFLDRFIKPNTLYAETGPVIETPLAAISTLHEFYLQDWGNTIRIFNSQPSGWHDASFVNMRAQGGFLVSATRQNDHTVYIRIESEGGNVCRIKTDIPAEQLTIKDINGKVVPFSLTDNEATTIEFGTVQGSIYELTDKTRQTVYPTPILHPAESPHFYGDGNYKKRLSSTVKKLEPERQNEPKN